MLVLCAAMAELRFTKDGVPIFDGSPELYVPYRRASLNYVETLEWKKRMLAGPRLQAALEGPARVAVQHQSPGWISHHEGALQLLNFLKGKVQAPTLAEAGKSISKFFYSVKRRKGETMNAWIVRHDEALYDARRTLAEAIQEYGGRDSHTRRSSTSTQSFEPRSLGAAASEEESRENFPFREDGRMQDDEGDYEEQSIHSNSTWGDHFWHGRNEWSSWDWHSYSHHDSWQPWSGTASTNKYDVSDAASVEADKFLPDFVIAYMLLQRSGLDTTERGSIVSNLRNRFTSEQVKSALRLAWPDDEIKRRDQFKGTAMFHEAETEEALFQEEASEDECIAQLTEEEASEYSLLTKETESAFQAFQHARRTLKDAREKQSLFKKNRQFYPMKRDSMPRAKWDNTGNSAKRCFKCGGSHATHECTTKTTTPPTTQSAHLAFQVSGNSEPMVYNAFQQNEEATAFSLTKILQEGKAIIDGGATSSVGSVSALERVLKLQAERQHEIKVEVETEDQPSFKFGNGGRKQCMSTAKLGVPLGGKTGEMKIHVHDIEGQPVLLSISALRALGAVIDFSADEMILKAVDARKVIKLEREAGGHQTFPLASDVMADSCNRVAPFLSLRDEPATE